VAGVWSLPQPMPGPLGYIVVYAVEVDDGVVLVDAGWDRSGGLEGLDRSLQTLGADVRDVRGVLFTHSHFDHYAVGDLIRDASGAWLALHEDERSELGRDVAVLGEYYAGLGLDSEERDEAIETELRMWSARPAFEPDRRLRDGDVVAGLRVLHTPGHAPGHVCFLAAERGIVFSGDHVLSRTTPNVSIFSGSRAASPLDAYLRSLDVTQALAGLRALPAHEEQCDIGARSTELLAHHDRQLRHAESLAAEGTTVREAAARMEWTRPWSELGPIDRHLALGETYAHLVALEQRGTLERLSGRPLRWAPAR
jgi:glyoxylase-like metal-dependent hydrolase (beta-lactamase superfamily II)